MCDFRIIKKIKLLKTDEVIQIDNIKNIMSNEYYHEPLKEKDVGLYRICQTGSFYAYWNGSMWIHEFGTLVFSHKDENGMTHYKPREDVYNVIEFDQDHSSHGYIVSK